jgi:hypothetical protein
LLLDLGFNFAMQELTFQESKAQFFGCSSTLTIATLYKFITASFSLNIGKISKKKKKKKKKKTLAAVSHRLT